MNQPIVQAIMPNQATGVFNSAVTGSMNLFRVILSRSSLLYLSATSLCFVACSHPRAAMIPAMDRLADC